MFRADPARCPGDDRLAARDLPDAEHIMMRGVGHVPMTDDPHFVARVLLRGSRSTLPLAAVIPSTQVHPAA